MEVQLKETERIDDLQLKGLKLIQDTNWILFRNRCSIIS